MLKEKEVKILREGNHKLLRELLGFSCAIGVSLGPPSRLGESLKIVNVILLVINTISMYGHWGFVNRFGDDMSMAADSISISLQSIIAMVKMIYLLFVQQEFARLLSLVESHDLIRKIEIFSWENFSLRQKLKEEITKVMDSVWLSTRRQLLIFMTLCVCIMSNYIFGALFINFYHYLRETPNYIHILPGSAFYPCWKDKGMSFPYYPLQMLIHSISLYIAGVGAVSFNGIFTVLCCHGIGLVKVLEVMLKLSTSSLVPKHRRTQYLRYCIYHYQRIEEYLNEIQVLYKHITLSEITLSLFIFGLVLFRASVNLSNMVILIRMVLYIAAAFYGIVIFCYNGQRLTDATENLPLAFYSCAWYDESKEFRQLIQMMILRTNRSFRLDISWFTKMTLTTLLFIAKTSCSYFLLLRNVTDDNKQI